MYYLLNSSHDVPLPKILSFMVVVHEIAIDQVFALHAHCRRIGAMKRSIDGASKPEFVGGRKSEWNGPGPGVLSHELSEPVARAASLDRPLVRRELSPGRVPNGFFGCEPPSLLWFESRFVDSPAVCCQYWFEPGLGEK